MVRYWRTICQGDVRVLVNDRCKNFTLKNFNFATTTLGSGAAKPEGLNLPYKIAERDKLHEWFWSKTAIGMLITELAQRMNDDVDKEAKSVSFGIAR